MICSRIESDQENNPAGSRDILNPGDAVAARTQNRIRVLKELSYQGIIRP